MLFKFIRENKVASWLLTVLRLYLGWTWMTGGWHKLTGGFDSSGFLANAVQNPVLEKGTQEALYPTFTGFLEHFALPHAQIFNFLIPLGEFLVGLGLILGCLTTAAAFFGLLMNFMFLFAGTVSSNPWMVLIGIIILVAGSNAGKFGADYFVIPFFKKMMNRKPKELKTE